MKIKKKKKLRGGRVRGGGVGGVRVDGNGE